MAPTNKSSALWEIISFPVTGESTEDPSLVFPSTNVLCEGSQHEIFMGLGVEQPHRVTLFVGWHSIEQHISFTQSSAFVQLSTGELEVRHVTFYSNDKDVLLALRAPVTELSWMCPKRGIDNAEFQRAIEIGTDLFRNDGRCLGSAWGVVDEPEILRNATVYVAGWNSMEERDKAVEELFNKMHACAEGVHGLEGKETKSWEDISDLITVVHVKLRPVRVES